MNIDKIEINIETTMRKAEMLYLEKRYNRSAKCLDDSGFMAYTEHDGCMYNIFLNIFHTKGAAAMEVGCGIVCHKEARSQVSEYIAQINCHIGEQKFQLNDTGEIYVCSEASLENSPLKIVDLLYMEASSIKLLIAFSSVLNKLAHLKLITAEETDINQLLERAQEIDLDDLEDIDYMFDFDEDEGEKDPDDKEDDSVEEDFDFDDDECVFPECINSTDEAEKKRSDSYNNLIDELFGDDNKLDEEIRKYCLGKTDSLPDKTDKVNLMNLIMEEVEEKEDAESTEEDDDDGNNDDDTEDDNQ